MQTHGRSGRAAPGAAGSQSSHRAAIAPVEDRDERPIWSVMIPAYNCEQRIGTAIESVLAQDPGPERMQIEVVDDCSTDRTATVAAGYGDRVALLRQPANRGNVGNFNVCIARSRGRIVHLLHGDDAVRPGFYERLEEPLRDRSDIGAAFCRYIAIDGDDNWTTISPLESATAGVLDGWAEKLALGQRLQPPCMVVRRTTYERLGGFDDRITYAEDWEMWTRIAAAYPVWHDPAPLALYRVHEGTVSDRTLRTGANVADLRRAIAINRESLPADRAAAISREAQRIAALTAIRRGRRRLGTGDAEAAAAQQREATATSRSPRVLAGALLLQALRIRRWILVKIGRR